MYEKDKCSIIPVHVPKAKFLQKQRSKFESENLIVAIGNNMVLREVQNLWFVSSSVPCKALEMSEKFWF